MEGIDEAAHRAISRTSDTARSPSGSAEPLGTLPPAFVPTTDRAIPDRVWSGWSTTGERRRIRRALEPEERRALEHRVVQLRPWLAGYSRPGQDDDVMLALAEMYNGFPSLRGDVGVAAATRLNAAMRVLEPFPAWAIALACQDIRNRGYEVIDRGGEVRRERHWPPSEPEIVKAVGEVLATRRAALASAEALLAAPIEEAIEETPEQRAAVIAKWDAHKTRKIEAEQLTAEQAEQLRRQGEARLKRTLEDRRQEYVRAGLEPPAEKYGIITSLPMMLSRGWTIEEMPGGQRKLVAPPRRVPARHETDVTEMGT